MNDLEEEELAELTPDNAYERGIVARMLDELESASKGTVTQMPGTRAYESGFRDGMEEFEGDPQRAIDWAEEHPYDTWSGSLIKAMGSDECAEIWGVEAAYDSDGVLTKEFKQACLEYERGVLDAFRIRVRETETP